MAEKAEKRITVADPPPVNSGVGSGVSSTNDTRLISLIRGHASQIVGALAYRAAVYGEAHQMSDMAETLALANEFSTLCNVAATPMIGGTPNYMTAAAAGTGS